jgi:hypothetical protein
MAKKNQNSAAPEVSKLPIKQDESPLVIDLPDGQKLVVGRMENGSVIEVATWRGTGRPDSRTSRLMLGMSSSVTPTPDTNSTESAKPDSKPSAQAIGKAVAQEIMSLIKKIPFTPITKKINAKFSKKNDKPFVTTVSNKPRSSESDEVEDWLNNILAKSEAATIKKAAADKPALKTTPAKKAPAKKAPAKKAPAKKAAAKNAKGGTR